MIEYILFPAGILAIGNLTIVRIVVFAAVVIILIFGITKISIRMEVKRDCMHKSVTQQPHSRKT